MNFSFRFLKVTGCLFRDRMPSAWYWDLIDNGHAPSSTWLIWSELFERETQDLVADRALGILEEDDEKSAILSRIREFQRADTAEELDKTKYDRFGIELI
jgi:hypothetical protein